jgi:hypothetical protein
MFRNRGPVFLAVIAVILASCLSAVSSPFSSGTDRTFDCAIDDGPCSKQLADTGITATFAITPTPVKEMKDLAFRVGLKAGAAPVADGEVSLYLSMPGMTMARNFIRLAHRGEGKYEGSGVIVKCPSGSGVWQAEVRIRRPSPRGQPHRVSFTFRVK